MYQTMTKLKKYIGDLLVTVYHSWGMVKGNRVPLQYLATFTVLNGRPYVPLEYPPPAYPNIPSGAAAHEHKRLRAKNNYNQRHYHTYKHVICIYVNQISKAIESVSYAKLGDPSEGINSIDVQIFVNHIMDHYCKIEQDDIDKTLISPIKVSILFPLFPSTVINKEFVISLQQTLQFPSPIQPW